MIDYELFLEATETLDPGHELIRQLPAMVEKARKAAIEEAKSYRGILVGAAGLAVKPPTADSGTYVAGNIKPNEHGTTKCAEKLMLKKAGKAGFTAIAGIVVAASVGLEEIESIVEASPRTLPPCEPCSTYFNGSPLMRKDTVIISTPLNSDNWQIHLNGELRRIYLSGDRQQLEEAPTRFGFEDWQRWLDNCDTLAVAELQAATAHVASRPVGTLVQMALLAS